MADLGIKAEKSQQRFRELNERAKQVDTYKSRAEQADKLNEYLTEIGADADQFAAALSYLQLVNSGESASLERAYDVMKTELQTLAKKLGREAPGINPLDAHPDLKGKVETGEIESQIALELAQHRARTQYTQEHRQRVAQQQEQARAEQQAALRDLNSIGQRLLSDPDYNAKLTVLMPKINEIKAKFPPREWATQFLAEYSLTKLKATPAHTPLRPTGMQPGVSIPADPREAFMKGINQI